MALYAGAIMSTLIYSMNGNALLADLVMVLQLVVIFAFAYWFFTRRRE